MRTKMLMSMLLIVVAAALVGGATVAIFTDQATNTGNTFTAGTVNIEAGSTTLGVGAGNMAPGDTVSSSFVVQNVGSLELRFDVSASGAGDLFSGGTPAVVGDLGDDQDVILGPGEWTTVDFDVSLPLGAGNWYQGKAGTVNLAIDAEQTANN